jgi:nicotinate-nucleotide pyrophosphorylase (carboxylating)
MVTANTLTAPTDVSETVRRALTEDVGQGDLTAALIPSDARATATVIAREEAVICGAPWFDEVFRQIDPDIVVEWKVRDGGVVAPGAECCRVRGRARSLLTAERTALNFLQTLSGTATLARRYADAVRHTQTRILDTRKTLPGLRRAQKYAVACGGGVNHRIGLFDAILVKENHIMAAGSISAALRAAERHAPTATFIEIEVETLGQLREALDAGAQRILLDNFDLSGLRAAVAETRGRAVLEASGGITLDTLASVAETGVDYISIGDLTKNVKAIDLSMRFTAA